MEHLGEDIKLNEINTKAYWNDRFEGGDWEKYNGIAQSQFFAGLAYKTLPDFFKSDLQKNCWDVQDIGCAEGDGTSYLAKHFPSCHFIGLDFSDVAVEKAKLRYSNCEFHVADVYKELPISDVIFSSNTLEHLKDVRPIFIKLCNSSTKYTVFLLPFEDDTDIKEHINRFEESFFPLVVEQSYLEYFDIVDCDEPYWKGKQILLIYTNSKYRPNNMALRDINLSFHKKIQDILKKLDQKQQEVLSLCAKNKDLSDAYKNCQAELAIQGKEYEKKLIALQNDLDERDHKITVYARTIDEIQKEKCSTEQALSENKRKIEYNEQQISELERQADRAATLNDSLMSEKQQMSSNIRFIVEDSLHSRPYKLAYFFHRFVQQGIRASRIERKNFRKWFTSKLFRKEVAEDFQYNPFLRIQYVLDHCTIQNEASKALQTAQSSKSSDINKVSVQQRLQKDVPNLREGRFFDWIINETLWIENLDNDCVSNISISILQSIFSNDTYKGIIVYPATIPWEPFQTPQQLLVAFAAEGYLCIFCEKPGSEHKGVYLLQKNILAVPEDVFLKSIGNRQVLVMLTWMGSVPFVEHISNKKIWYHVLDQLDIFSLYDDSYLAMHNWMVQHSDWVSYVAKPLLKCLEGREDTIYLPNACHAEELISTSAGEVPEDMKSIMATGHPIIGYFGWIAEWMDYDLLEKVVKKRPNYEFVMIGPMDETKDIVSKGVERLKQYPNIHFLGRKKYEDLPAYARRFQVGTVPFLINEMMNCVSPIKFYEYCAYGIPTITSYMPEMESYSCEFVRCYHTENEYMQLLDEFVGDQVQAAAQKEAPLLALKNTWKARAKLIGALYHA